MESSIHSIAQYVVAVGIILGVTVLGASMAALGVVMLLSAARNHEREEHPNDGSAKGVPLEALLPTEIFAVPMYPDRVALRALLGERECLDCHRPTSQCGVLTSVRMRGADLWVELCAECTAIYRGHVVERQALSVVHGDLSDMEIRANVLPFPDSASTVKRGMVS